MKDDEKLAAVRMWGEGKRTDEVAAEFSKAPNINVHESAVFNFLRAHREGSVNER